MTMREDLHTYTDWVAAHNSPEDAKDIKRLAEDILDLVRSFPHNMMTVQALTLAMATFTAEVEDDTDEDVLDDLSAADGSSVQHPDGDQNSCS